MSCLPGSLAVALESSSRLLSSLEQGLFQVALFAKLAVEGLAVAIILLAIVATLPQLLRRWRSPRRESHGSIRLKLGLALSLALEFLVAADILGTAVSPSWDAIARLAAIAGIRTFLNFFLHQEVRELERVETQRMGMRGRGNSELSGIEPE